MKTAMTELAPRNFHLPLPPPLYRELREAARRRGIPATALAREVIAEWLAANRRLVVAESVAEYAAATAGSLADLDPELEAATVEALRPERDR